MAFKDQLTKLRKRNNITQTDLANKMNVKQYVISSWETGRSEPSIDQIIELSSIFNVPTDYILDRNIICTSSSTSFESTLDNIKLDSYDDFLSVVNNLCSGLSDNKRQKLLNIIKASVDLTQ